MSSGITWANPYLGPRAFSEDAQEQRLFFGRDREQDQLLDLLIARRLVLLHAPSGAGKTSLIHAALIPRLRAEGFSVHPTVRINAAVPPELADRAPNRYLLATLLSLDEGRAAEERSDPAALAQTDLDSYLRRTQRRAGADELAGDEVLIFDQFEELLTVDPTDRADQETFLTGLGKALEHPRRWALFAIREDYLGSLRPLLVTLPTRLDALFRLDLLDPQQAIQAIQGPARGQGVTFTDAAAARLTDDLRRSTVQRADGTSVVIPGQVIEPVQLQVVCYRLWEAKVARNDSTATITPEDLEAAGTVDIALQAYYAERVVAAAAAAGLAERRVRAWVEAQLINPAGLRSQVLRQPETTNGLPNPAIQALIDAHLVRAETRRGATWFELAHDRLIVPVRADNVAWYAANLTPFQRQASLWEEQGRPDGLLLRDEALQTAEQWALAADDDLTEVEGALLATSQKARAQRERERRANRLLRLLLLIVLLFGSVAMALAGVAWVSNAEALRQRDAAEAARNEAQRQATAESHARQTAEAARSEAEVARRVARVNELASRAESELSLLPQRALLLAIEANQIQARAAEPVAPAARQSLYQTLSAIGGIGLGVTDSPPTDLAVSADGRWLAVGTQDGRTWLWAIAPDRPPQPPVLLADYSLAVRAVAFSPDGSRLATGGRDAQVVLWDLQAGAADAVALQLDSPAQPITMLRFSPDGRWLFGAGASADVWRWDVQGNRALTTLSGHSSPIRDLAVSPDGRWLVTASEDGTLRRWEVGAVDPSAGAFVLISHTASASRVLITPDSNRAISGGLDGTLRSAALALTEPGELFNLAAGFAVVELALSTDERWLVATDGNNQTARWDLRATDIAASRIAFNERAAHPIFSAMPGEESILFAAGGNRSLRSWQLGETENQARERLLGHESQPLDLERSADGRWLASVGARGDVRLWDVTAFTPTIPLPIVAGTGLVSTTLVDNRLALAGADNTISLHDLSASNPREPAASLSTAVGTVNKLVGAGRWLAWLGSDGAAQVADIAVDDPEQTIKAVDTGGVALGDLAISADGTWLAGLGSGQLLLWPLDADGEALTGQPIKLPIVGGRILADHFPNGRAVAVGTIDGRIELIELSDGAARQAQQLNPTPSEATDAIEQLALSPDGQRVAAIFRQSGTSASMLRVWKRDQIPEPLLEFAPEGGAQITTLAFSPDGRWLAAGSNDRLLQLWDLQHTGGSPHRTALRGHEGVVHSLAFSPDNQSLVSAGDDGSLRLWSLDAAAQGRPLVLRRNLELAPLIPVKQVAFSADQHWLITAGDDGNLRLWNLQPDALLAQACWAAGRELGPEEWLQFFPNEPNRALCAP